MFPVFIAKAIIKSWQPEVLVLSWTKLPWGQWACEPIHQLMLTPAPKQESTTPSTLRLTAKPIKCLSSSFQCKGEADPTFPRGLPLLCKVTCLESPAGTAGTRCCSRSGAGGASQEHLPAGGDGARPAAGSHHLAVLELQLFVSATFKVMLSENHAQKGSCKLGNLNRD